MGRPRILDATKLERLLEDARQKTARQLARDYGVSLMTVYRLFEAFGVKEWGRKRLSSSEIEMLIAEADTYTPAELAKKYGIARNTVYRILKRHSIRLDKPKTNRIVDQKLVLELREQGHSLRSIAKQLSCSHERVRQIVSNKKQSKDQSV